MSYPTYTKIDVGPDTVVEIDKLYGPLVACAVRVRLDVNQGQWVIERERIRSGTPVERPDGTLYSEDSISFEEVFRFDCQESIDFDR